MIKCLVCVNIYAWFVSISVSAVATGTLFEVAQVPQWLWYAVLVFAICHVISALVLEIYTRFEQPNVVMATKTSSKHSEPKAASAVVNEGMKTS